MMKKITLLVLILTFCMSSYSQTTCPESIKSNSTPDEPTFVLSNGQNGCNEVTWPATILVDGLTYSFVSCSGGNLKYVMDAGQTAPASFEVTVDYGNGLICDYDASGSLITLSTLDFEKEKVTVNIFPNPMTKGDQLNINFSDALTGRIELYNITGQNIYSKKLTHSNNETITVENINKGIYLIKIEAQQFTIVKKVILN